MEVDTDNPLIEEYARILQSHSRILILQICLNPTPQSYLAKMIGIERSGISRHVSELVDMGLIRVSKKNGVKTLETIHNEIVFQILPFSSELLYSRK